MSPTLAAFIADCAAAKVGPRDALRAGGVDATLWKKWEDGRVSPTLRSLDQAKAGLQRLQREQAAALRRARAA